LGFNNNQAKPVEQTSTVKVMASISEFVAALKKIDWPKVFLNF
jgi:hypothetical protein